MELDSTVTNPLEKLSKSKRKRLRKARKEVAAKLRSESMDHIKSGGDTVTNPLEKLSKSKRKRLRKAGKKAATKLRSESMDHMKSGGDTLTNPLMKLSKSKRKRLRKARKKAAAKLGPESMDDTNIISNLSLADASDVYAVDNINNGSYLSQETRCSTENGICEKAPQVWDSWPEVSTPFYTQASSRILELWLSED